MTTLLQHLYYDWFDNKQYWFNTDITIDKYLCDKYFGLLNYNNYKTKNEFFLAKRPLEAI